MNWKAMIFTYLALFLFGNVFAFRNDGLNVTGALGITLGVMIFPLLVAALPAWFLNRGRPSLMDWKVFSVAYVSVSFVSQVGMLRNAGVDELLAVSQIAAGMITTLVIALLVGWIENRRRNMRTSSHCDQEETA